MDRGAAGSREGFWEASWAFWQDGRFLAVVAVTFWVLLAGFLLKAPCMELAWDGSQFDHYCYTDLPVIYHGRGLADGEMPYVEAWNEYPVVTGLWQYGMAALGDDAWDFFVANAIGLGLVALLVTALLSRLVPDPRRVLLWAAAPPLALYAFHNWDLLAVGAAVVGVCATRRSWWAAAGVAFAVGASAKVWPGLFLVFLGLALLRDHRWGVPTQRFVLGATATMVLLHVPFLLLDAELYLSGYAWHLTRGPTYESWWGIARTWAGRWEIGWAAALFGPVGLGILTKLLLFSGLGLLALAVWRRWLGGLEATFGAVLVFMTTNQVFSVQYALWLLPFFVLLPRFPIWLVLLFFASDLAVQATIWPLFGAITRGDPDWFTTYYEPLSWASTFRFVVLVAAIAVVARWAALRRARVDRPSANPLTA